MRRTLGLVGAAAALLVAAVAAAPACGPIAPPGTYADLTAADERAIVQLERDYKAEGAKIDARLKSGDLVAGSPEALEVARADRVAFAKLSAARAAYDAANINGFRSALEAGRSAVDALRAAANAKGGDR